MKNNYHTFRLGLQPGLWLELGVGDVGNFDIDYYMKHLSRFN